MSWALIGSIIAAITAVFVGGPKMLETIKGLLQTYLPAKSTEQKVEEGSQKIDDQIKKEQESGRP